MNTLRLRHMDLIFYFIFYVVAESFKAEEDLVDMLFADYKKDVIPQINLTAPLFVTMELALFSVISLVSSI